jgi:hypothetical protein
MAACGQENAHQATAIKSNCGPMDGSVSGTPSMPPQRAARCTAHQNRSRQNEKGKRNYVLRFGLPTSPPIGQALPDNALDGFRHALGIFDPEFGTIVVNEIALGKVSGKVLLRDVMMRPVN